MSVKDPSESPSQKRRGVIAVCVREGRLLVIQRSRHVAAPLKFCFPGGAIEDGESESEALVRELREELNVTVTPLERLWQSETDWGVELRWWLADLETDADIRPNPEEVAGFYWRSPDELRKLSGLLSSNLAFLGAMDAGEFSVDGLDSSGD